MKRYLRAGALLLVLAVAALAVGSAQAKGPKPPPAPPPPPLSFSPDSYDFGNVTVGFSASEVFTLSYAGSGKSGKLLTSITGDPAFSITADTCWNATLSADETCSITVTYAPTGTDRDASALIALWGVKTPVSATANVSGTGVAPG